MAHLITGHAGTPHVTSSDAGILNGMSLARTSFVEYGFDFTRGANNRLTVNTGVGMICGRLFEIENLSLENVTFTNASVGNKKAVAIVAVYRYSEQDDTEEVTIEGIDGVEVPESVDVEIPDTDIGDLWQGDNTAALYIGYVVVNSSGYAIPDDAKNNVLYAIREESGLAKATGSRAHAECESTAGDRAHSEGQAYATGTYSHAENASNSIGESSHAENVSNSYGESSHAENFSNAYGNFSHSEGKGIARGEFSHAEGESEAIGDYSHSSGRRTVARYDGQFVVGQFNEDDEDALFIVGSGEDDDNRSNAFVVKRDGTVSSDYFESKHAAFNRYGSSNKIGTETYNTSANGRQFMIWEEDENAQTTYSNKAYPWGFAVEDSTGEERKTIFSVDDETGLVVNDENITEQIDKVNNDLHQLDTNVVKLVSSYENTGIDASSGEAVSSANFTCSDYIQLVDGETYTFTYTSASDYPRFAFYRADKSFINRINGNNSASQTFTMPSDAKYIRFFTNKNSYATASIVAIGDLGNKVASVNASLNDYGFDNLAGEFQQGYWSSTDLSLVNNYYNVCNKTPLSVTNGDIVTVKVVGSKHIRIIFSNGTSVVGTDKKENVSEFSMTAPSGSTKVYINVDGNTTTITPTTVGHIGVYINNEIDEVKAALGFSKTVVKEYEITVNANSVGQVNLDSTQKNNLFAVANIWYNGTDGFVNVEPSVIYVKNVTNAQKVFKLKVMAFF